MLDHGPAEQGGKRLAGKTRRPHSRGDDGDDCHLTLEPEKLNDDDYEYRDIDTL